MAPAAAKDLVKEAEEFRTEDADHRARVAATMQLKQEMDDIRKTIDDPNFRISKKDYDEIDGHLNWLRDWIRGMGDEATAVEVREQIRKLSEYVDPKLQELFKGIGLAARNCGILEKRKRKFQLLIKSDEAIKAIVDKKQS